MARQIQQKRVACFAKFSDTPFKSYNSLVGSPLRVRRKMHEGAIPPLAKVDYIGKLTWQLIEQHDAELLEVEGKIYPVGKSPFVCNNPTKTYQGDKMMIKNGKDYFDALLNNWKKAGLLNILTRC
tara:strand:- start:1208 stop:1582 length:375 start_codon:yes stop_codon:yes gene_type:complete